MKGFIGSFRCLRYSCVLFLAVTLNGCREKEHQKMPVEIIENVGQAALRAAAKQQIDTWLVMGISGVQFLKTSKWKIDEQVFLNSTGDRGYLLLLNQDEEPGAEMDYIQLLYGVKEKGSWKIYLQSLPNMVVPRKKENGKFLIHSLEELAVIGRKQAKQQCEIREGVPNDEAINQEYSAGLKRNHLHFLSKKIDK